MVVIEIFFSPIMSFTEILVSLALALNFFVNNLSRRSFRDDKSGWSRLMVIKEAFFIDVNICFSFGITCDEV